MNVSLLKSGRVKGVRFETLAKICEVLGGCASSRVLKAPVPTQGLDLGWEAAAPDGLSVAVDQVIVPNGGGSWVRDASWDEYVLTVGSASQMPVEIEGIELYSAKLALPVQTGNTQEQLAIQRGRLQQSLRDVGLVGSTSAGIVSAATVAAVLVFPIAVIGGTSYVVSRRNRVK